MASHALIKTIFIYCLLLLTACNHVSFSPTDSTTATSANAKCVGNLSTATVPTKILFVLDMSGSNQSNVGCTIGPNCTDPTKSVRAGSIQSFISDYGSHINISWGLEVFQGTTATPLTSGFVDVTIIQQALSTFMGMVDWGDTPYLAALNSITTLITNDPDLHSNAHPQYLVVFMSDGQPNGSIDSAGTTDTILNQVQIIENLDPGRITFNTVYYGPADPTASGLLKSMSMMGSGNFLDTSSNPTGLDFSIGDLIHVPCPN